MNTSTGDIGAAGDIVAVTGFKQGASGVNVGTSGTSTPGTGT